MQASQRSIATGVEKMTKTSMTPIPTSAAAPGKRDTSDSWAARLSAAMGGLRRAVLGLGAFSLVINLLMLAGPLYMLQIYDRVLTSHSEPTLIAISLLLVGLYGFMAALEIVRSRVLVRIGVGLDRDLGSSVFEAGLRSAIGAPGASSAAPRDLDTLRQFFAGVGPAAVFDTPWVPIYLGVVFLFHPLLGFVALLGMLVLAAIALANSLSSRRPMVAGSEASREAASLAEAGQRNIEVLAAMGMMSAMIRRWRAQQDTSVRNQSVASDRSGTFTTLSKTFRLFLQSAMLGFGAWLALQQEVSPGVMIAASIIAGRALAPVEQLIAQYRQFGRARLAYSRLKSLLGTIPEQGEVLTLPRPSGRLSVGNLVVAAPESGTIVLGGADFTVEPGEAVAVIGPSSAGKSSLARALVGVWHAASGSVRIDGATLDQWSQEDRGRYLGYLPQDVELFDGTVAENIRRLGNDEDDETVIAAAQAAGLDRVIRNLPDGYQTRVGPSGANLSGGMRQRIGLARALYGDPALVVLDEPNAHLDHEGEVALAKAIDMAKAKGQTFVIIAHRPGVVASADKVLILEEGRQRAYGPREEILNNVVSVADSSKSRAA